MIKQPLHVSEIALGQALRWDVYDAQEKLLLRKGEVVAHQHQLDALVERGLFVDASDYSRSRNGAGRGESELLISNYRAPEQKEIPSTLRLVNKADAQLEPLLAAIRRRTGEPNLPAKALEISRILHEAIAINPEIALACILFNPKADEYVVRPHTGAAILAIMTAQAMGKPDEETMRISAAALTMNAVQRQQDQDGDDAAIDRQHPQKVVDLLRLAGVTDEGWLDWILLHHENIDGSGYPFGKSGNEIPENASLLSLADRYLDLLSPQPSRAALLPGEALRRLLLDRGKGVDPVMAAHFIRILGIHPPGTFVRLQNGELGVVSHRGHSATTPVVHVLLGQRDIPLPYPYKRDTGDRRYAIAKEEHANAADIPFNMQQIWGKEAMS